MQENRKNVLFLRKVLTFTICCWFLQNINTVESEFLPESSGSSESEENLFPVVLQNKLNENNEKNQPIVVHSLSSKYQSNFKYVTVKIHNVKVKFLVDSGCSIGFIDKNTFDKLKYQNKATK